MPTRLKFYALILLVCSLSSRAQNHDPKFLLLHSSLDSNEKFSVYLPKDYSPAKKYPVIIFLDPAARAELPLSVYSTLSDKYGIILAGSWNSRNFENGSGQAVAAIYNGLLLNYSIDTSHIILSGFSGGARAASELAILNPFFYGVINCGAGFSSVKITTERRISFAGIVGNRDMNFEELYEVKNDLDAIDNDNVMIVFDGGHTWPPVDYYELAYAWMMQKSLDVRQVFPLKQKWITDIERAAGNNEVYFAYFTAQQMATYQALHSAADSIVNVLSNDRNFKKDKGRFERSIEDEQDYDRIFFPAFLKVQTFDSIDSVKISDWSDKINSVRVLQRSKDPYRQLAGMRCQDRSARACVEAGYQNVLSNHFVQAFNLYHLISFFSPDSSLSYLLMATAAAGMGDKNLALRNLKISIQKGLPVSDRVLYDAQLRKLFTKEELSVLFKK